MTSLNYNTIESANKSSCFHITISILLIKIAITIFMDLDDIILLLQVPLALGNANWRSAPLHHAFWFNTNHAIFNIIIRLSTMSDVCFLNGARPTNWNYWGSNQTCVDLIKNIVFCTHLRLSTVSDVCFLNGARLTNWNY